MSDNNLIDIEVEKRFSDVQIPDKLKDFQEELLNSKKDKNKKLFNIEEEEEEESESEEDKNYLHRPNNLDDLIKSESPFFKVRENSPKMHRKIKRTSELKEKNPYEDDNEETSMIQNKNKIEIKNTIDNSFSTSSRNSSFSSKNSKLLDKPIFEIEMFDSLYKTIFQIINVIIKYSLVQIAYCIKVLGLFWGPLAILLISFLSLVSLHLLLVLHKRTGERNYLVFSEKSFGKLGKIIILFINFISAYGSCWSFVIICLKVIPNILSMNFGNKHFSGNTFVSVVLGIILFFFCYQKDITGIKKAAQFGVIGIILFFIITIIDFLYSVYTEDDSINLIVTQYILKKDYFKTDNFEEIITAISIIILCYTYHSFTFSIYGCLGNITLKQYFVTASVTVFLCTFIYLICGVLGYLLYSDEIKDSILDGIGNGPLNTLLSLCNVANVIMTFPISFSSVKNYFLFILEVVLTYLRNFFLFIFGCFKCVKKIKDNIYRKEKRDNKRFLGKTSSVALPKYVELVLILGLYISIFVLANKYQKLKIIFSFLGGIMGNIFSFIFPAFFYFFLGRKKGETFSLNVFIATFLFIIGAFTLVTCLYSTLISV